MAINVQSLLGFAFFLFKENNFSEETRNQLVSTFAFIKGIHVFLKDQKESKKDEKMSLKFGEFFCEKKDEKIIEIKKKDNLGNFYLFVFDEEAIEKISTKVDSLSRFVDKCKVGDVGTMNLLILQTISTAYEELEKQLIKRTTETYQDSIKIIRKFFENLNYEITNTKKNTNLTLGENFILAIIKSLQRLMPETKNSYVIEFINSYKDLLEKEKKINRELLERLLDDKEIINKIIIDKIMHLVLTLKKNIYIERLNDITEVIEKKFAEVNHEIYNSAKEKNNINQNKLQRLDMQYTMEYKKALTGDLCNYIMSNSSKNMEVVENISQLHEKYTNLMSKKNLKKQQQKIIKHLERFRRQDIEFIKKCIKQKKEEVVCKKMGYSFDTVLYYKSKYKKNQNESGEVEDNGNEETRLLIDEDNKITKSKNKMGTKSKIKGKVKAKKQTDIELFGDVTVCDGSNAVCDGSEAVCDGTGHYNTGYNTIGHYNTKYDSIGHYNTKYNTIGHYNTGYNTIGHYNTGYDTVKCNNAGHDTVKYNNTKYDSIDKCKRIHKIQSKANMPEKGDINEYYDIYDKILKTTFWLNAKWKKPFRKVVCEYSHTFYKGTREQRTSLCGVLVNFMCQNNLFNFYSNELLDAVQLTYNIERLSCIFVLPKNNVSIEQVMEFLTQNNALNKLVNSMKLETIRLRIPKFESSVNLNFDCSVSYTKKRFSFLGSVSTKKQLKNIYENKLVFYEEGTTTEKKLPPDHAFWNLVYDDDINFEFNCNRPFLYFLMYSFCGQHLPLFVGTQTYFE